MSQGPKNLPLFKILITQGIGTRKQCIELIRKTGVNIKGEKITDPYRDFIPDELQFEIEEQKFQYHAFLLIMMNKPVSVECSRKPQIHQSVFSYLPEAFFNRGLQPVGRLDVDTEGLLLLTDHGPTNHYLTSPKKGVSKTYRVILRHPLTETGQKSLVEGIMLKHEKFPVKAYDLSDLGNKRLEWELTITEGKYHQVKRMFAAVSNRVEKLCRIRIGDLELPNSLNPGEWKYLCPNGAGKIPLPDSLIKELELQAHL